MITYWTLVDMISWGLLADIPLHGLECILSVFTLHLMLMVSLYYLDSVAMLLVIYGCLIWIKNE